MSSPRIDLARPIAGLLAVGTYYALPLASPLPAQTPAEVQVTPETMTLAVDQKQPLFAAAYDRHGNLIASTRFTFWSSDTLVARVFKDGTVVGVGPGLARVEARARGRRASMAVLITGALPPGARVLALEPAALTLLPAEARRVTPKALREDGSAVALGRVSWTSLKPEVATVDSTGLVVGVSPGRGMLQAGTSDGLTATVTIDVAQAELALAPARVVLGPGESDTLRALVPAQGGREIPGGLQWRIGDSAVARVGPTGIVQGLKPGETTIVAAGFAQERSVPVLVHQAVEALEISPRQADGPIRIPLGETRRFSAVAEAADSTPIRSVRVAWEVADSAIVRFDGGTGTVRARAVGTTALTARLAGFEPAVWTIQVVPGRIELEHTRLGLGMGGQATIGAVLLGERGVQARATPALAWSSDRPGVVGVGEDGVVRGIRPGHAAVTATAPWGEQDTADVYVTGDLLVTSNRAGRGAGLYQLRSAAPEQLVPLRVDGADNIQGVFSPDRTRVAFSSDRGGSFDLQLMDADGRNPRPLTTGAGAEGEPAWTPDGSRLVYSAVAGRGSAQLFSIRPDGTDARRLTTSPGGNEGPAVSPDGRSVAFISLRDGNREVYLMDLDGANQRRITETDASESSPHFFPDGDLAFVVDRGGGSAGSRIVRLTPGGEHPTTLVETDQPIVSFGLSRDGQRLAYVVRPPAGARGGPTGSAFFLRSTAPGATAVAVPLRRGEQLLGPAF